MNSSSSSIATDLSGQDYYVVCYLSAGFGLVAIIISTIIVVVVRSTKPRLHTVRHLLMCNTCIASILYCSAQTINYMFLIFLSWITSDTACHWRGYFGYMSISAATYSYLVQAISRLFFSMYATSYPWVTSFRAHYLLILLHWIIVLAVPLPSVLTNDIYFRPGMLCWVPFKYLIHVVYTAVAYYLVPIVAILVIYVRIYRKVRRVKRAGLTILNTTNDKRDLEVLRNIVILLCIYIAGGVPSLLFMVTRIEILYYTGIVTFTFTVAIEKICTIHLDRELRQVVRGMLTSGNRVVPFESTLTRGREPNKTVFVQ